MAQADARDSSPSASSADLPEQMIAGLLAAAVAAPSMHNTQPWRFRVRRDCQTIELRADPARTLRYGDPSGRAVHVACGAALFNLRIAAAAAGRQPVVTLLPDPGQPLLLATVRLAGPCRAQEAERELHAAIPRRHTNRNPFSSRPVPPGVLAEFKEAARLEGAILHVLDYDETVRVLRLARDAERDQLADPAYRAELAQWAGGLRDREGIPDSALGPRSVDGRAPVRDFRPAQPGPRSYAMFEQTPQLAVLSTHFGGQADWLRAGQALQRVLLTATSRGISASPHTLPLEATDAWLVRDPRSGSEQPQMILRIGYGPAVPGAPRRPVSELLDEEAPGEDRLPGTPDAGGTSGL
jgi:nitroreductase